MAGATEQLTWRHTVNLRRERFPQKSHFSAVIVDKAPSCWKTRTLGLVFRNRRGLTLAVSEIMWFHLLFKCWFLIIRMCPRWFWSNHLKSGLHFCTLLINSGILSVKRMRPVFCLPLQPCMNAQKQPASVNCASWSTCQHLGCTIQVQGAPPPHLFFFPHYQRAFSIAAFICSSSRAVTIASGVTTAVPTLLPETRLIRKYMFGLICLATVEAHFNLTWETQ